MGTCDGFSELPAADVDAADAPEDVVEIPDCEAYACCVACAGGCAAGVS